MLTSFSFLEATGIEFRAQGSAEVSLWGMMLVDCCLNMILYVLCRARGRPDQRRTGTPCGTPGAPGANVPERVEGAPHTPSDDVSVPSKTLKSDAFIVTPA